jgi:hypothetical protein
LTTAYGIEDDENEETMDNEVVISGAGRCCPHCEVELTPEEIKTIWSSYTTALRQTLGGPKRMKRPCNSCGMVCASAREAWSHCRIPRGLDPAALLTYVLGRMPVELEKLPLSEHSRTLFGNRYASLDALHKALTGLLETKLKPAQKRQAKWYLGFVERAMDKLEDVA